MWLTQVSLAPVKRLRFQLNTLCVSKGPLVPLFPIPSLHPLPTLKSQKPHSFSLSFIKVKLLTLTVPSLPYFLVFLIQPHMTLKKPSNASSFLIRFFAYRLYAFLLLYVLFLLQLLLSKIVSQGKCVSEKDPRKRTQGTKWRY